MKFALRPIVGSIPCVLCLLLSQIDKNGFRAYCCFAAAVLLFISPVMWQRATWRIPTSRWLLNVFALLLGLIILLFPQWRAYGMSNDGQRVTDDLGYGFLFPPPHIPPSIHAVFLQTRGIVHVGTEPTSDGVYGELLLVGVFYWMGRLALQIAKEVKERRLKMPGSCHACGYDLRASPDRCPECGAIPQSAKSSI